MIEGNGPSHIIDSWRRLKLLSKKSHFIHNRESVVFSRGVFGQVLQLLVGGHWCHLASSRQASRFWVDRVMSLLPDEVDQRKTGSK